MVYLGWDFKIDEKMYSLLCFDRSWIFELWVDKMRYLESLTIVQAIASFLHLSFVFGLDYPKETQTVADILQRRFAKYGDDSGTKTHTRKETAQTKMSKYMTTLGEILSA